MPKEKIMVSIDKDVLAVVDQIAAELEFSRSQFIEAALENALEEWRFLRFVGLRPARIKRIAIALKKTGLFKSGDYEIEVPDDLEERIGIKEREKE